MWELWAVGTEAWGERGSQGKNAGRGAPQPGPRRNYWTLQEVRLRSSLSQPPATPPQCLGLVTGPTCAELKPPARL